MALTLLHVGPVDWKTHAGLNASIPGLVQSQAQYAGGTVGLLTTGSAPELPSGLSYPVYEWQHLQSVSMLPRPFNMPSVIIFHSTYIDSHRRLATQARDLDIPFVIVPRGGFTRNAQNVKRWKKGLANMTLYRPFFKNARSIQFLTEREKLESIDWGRPSFVMGNGVNLPLVLRTWANLPEDELKLTFIGRLAPYMKGLDLLIVALGSIRPVLDAHHVRVKLYGPDHEGGKAELQQLIKRYELDNCVSVHEPVTGGEKEVAFLDTDVFLHTSRAEGHPMSVLEALSYGVPCAVTEGTNIAETIEDSAAGWNLGKDSDTIAKGLIEVIESKGTFPETGARARELAERLYSWDYVGKKTMEAYRAVIGGQS